MGEQSCVKDRIRVAALLRQTARLSNQLTVEPFTKRTRNFAGAVDRVSNQQLFIALDEATATLLDFT